MLSDKIKIKISDFVLLIIENDAQLWGIIKKDATPNKNAFLNKLIPNMLAVRKERREKIKNVLENDFQRKDADVVYECVNTVIDGVYFRDEELDDLTQDIWIRPTKDTYAIFDEIENEELAITALNISNYIRSLLNEYARLPQYTRQKIFFRNEKELIKTACEDERILCFIYDGERYKVYAYWQIYQYTMEQRSYLVAYDIERHEISSFFTEKIKAPYLLKKKYIAPQYLLDIFKKYLESEDFDEYTILTIKEQSNKSEN